MQLKSFKQFLTEASRGLDAINLNKDTIINGESGKVYELLLYKIKIGEPLKLANGDEITVKNDEKYLDELSNIIHNGDFDKKGVRLKTTDNKIIWSSSLLKVNTDFAIRRKGQQIHNKALLPSKFGLNDGSYTVEEVKNAVLKKISTDEKLKHLDKMLIELMEAATNSNHKIEHYKDFSKSDINIVLKDFGEILSALYLSKNTNKIKFPKGNGELFDFEIVYNDGSFINYSNKASAGSSTSFAVLNKQNIKFDNQALKILAGQTDDAKTNVEKAVLLYKKYYGSKQNIDIFLSNLYGGNINTTTAKIPELINICSKIISNIKSDKDVDKFEDEFKKAFGNTRYDINKAIMNLKIKGNHKDTLGIFMAPVLYKMSKMMNDDSNLKEELSTKISNINGKQTNVEINNDGVLKVIVSEYNSIKVDFYWQGNMHTPFDNIIGFKTKI